MLVFIVSGMIYILLDGCWFLLLIECLMHSDAAFGVESCGGTFSLKILNCVIRFPFPTAVA